MACQKTFILVGEYFREFFFLAKSSVITGPASHRRMNEMPCVTACKDNDRRPCIIDQRPKKEDLNHQFTLSLDLIRSLNHAGSEIWYDLIKHQQVEAGHLNLLKGTSACTLIFIVLPS